MWSFVGLVFTLQLFEYSVFIFGPAFAWLLMDQPIAALQALGILCITFAGILIAYRSGST